MNKLEIGQRLREEREKSGLSRDYVIALPNIKISRSTLQQWENGATEPSITMIGELAKLYKVSPQYLIFGDDTVPMPQPVVPPVNDEYVYIPAYDIEVSAGHGSFVDNETPRKHLAFRKRWVQARGLNTKDLAAIFTKGDSMEPTIADGGVIVIDKAKNEAFDGKIYVLRIDDSLYVKRVQKIPSGIRLISDNKLYDPLDIITSDYTPEQFGICGQVIHVSYDLPD